ncbi:MAG: DNA-binding response regulator [Flavobacteriales bacterium CG18_big_fil_WC_8_21_14_2_50_32_9]|nr:response regulator transcription factor [Flavobacteriales bacterium]PIQ14429.1 MAG: DNA-binding response regulator [Flavobacteriales bacterium CG18_big_fil_WC_8_21_14_2_50_32_9]PJC62214.1 MAG: DNA-binding response regulator [Flavobacteriales bacterium CG_4_9_14_0_2_um_filter_32_27]
MEHINVFIVDDHSLIREGYKLILKKYKTEINLVGEASNGIEALEFLETNTNVDVVLLDITMPDMDGFELAKIITEKYPSIKILVLTMHNDEPYIFKMISLGIHGYILKDTTHAELIIALKTVHEGKKFYSNEVSSMMLNRLLHKNETTKKEEVLELTPKELEILTLVVQGLTSTEIAEMLQTSNRTIEAHRRSVMKKISVRNTAELVSYAIKNNLVA